MIDVRFRTAEAKDIPAIVALLLDDELGQGREELNNPAYETAFHAIEHDPNNTLIVGEASGDIVAVYQLTMISGFSLKAMRRAQIEGVRVASHLRGQGIGQNLIDDAENRARNCGAGLMQFSSNAIRNRAHAFYRKLGYEPSHVGFKKHL